MRKKIVITGMGAVTPVGIGVENYWKGLMESRCGIGEMTRIPLENLPVKHMAEVKDFIPKEHLSNRLVSDLDTFMQYAYVAAEEALRDSGLEPGNAETGIVMATALAGMALTGKTQEDLVVAGKGVSPRFTSKIMGNIAAAQLSINYGIKGPSLTVSTACSSGGDAVYLADLLLQSGAADAMIVMAGESTESPIFINGLSKAGALSKTGESRPFDINRNGFVAGEGGGALILETEEHALARKAKIKAVLAGCANNTDAFNTVSPEPDGAGAAECMRIALKQAGLQPEQIGYVNAHGTATQAGDVAETNALQSVFGDHPVWVSSTKGATGHMMGAGGLTEIIACIKAMETSHLPGNIGMREQDPLCPLRIVTGSYEKQSLNYAMSNALGFGGQNSCIITGKY